MRTEQVLVRGGCGTSAPPPILSQMPALKITENGDRIRLDLGGFAQGEGASLQEAADDLVCAILRLVMAFRSSGFRACPEALPDLEMMNFLHEVGDVAAAGGDIRSHVFA